MATGATREEAEERICEAIAFHIRELEEDGPRSSAIGDGHLRVITACMPDDEYWIDVVRTGRKK